MENQEAKELLKRYQAGTCTEAEKALLESWYLEWSGEAFDLSSQELGEIKDQGWNQILSATKRKPDFYYWGKYAAAILVLVFFSIGVMIHLRKENKQEIAQQAPVPTRENDAAPGSSKALLTLADGRVVPLDDAATGRIAEAGGVTIRKTADGMVVYEPAALAGIDPQNVGAMGYNQIATPRGGQHQIVLPDGTKVWLNAASSLRYPVQFSSEARRVELTGEGYFEVNSLPAAKGKRVPFLVSTPTQTVEVLGTHFNINSYADEAGVVTTLLEGAVNVSREAGGEKIRLAPGQQAVLQAQQFEVKAVNPQEAVAWKNGYFSFEEADLKTVMRQLSRWYNVDVVYVGEISAETFTGKFHRNMSLLKVMEILTYAQINFRMEGKKLIITS
ncbi:MAG: FecR family protein [Adhaeribacter sp.]